MKIHLLFALTLVLSARAEDSPGLAAALKSLPPNETAIRLFNGKDLDGWDGAPDYWSVEEEAIKAVNEAAVAASTYLFTKDNYRNFRLLLDVKQTLSPRHSTMHSAVAAVGERITETDGNAHGFRGPLLMFCHDWGIWDANRRNRIEPAQQKGALQIAAEKKGDWNLIEILVIGDRIRFAANGTQVFDFTDKPGMLRESPIGLQLHANDKPQEYRFRGLVLTKDPEDRLVTVR
jgi:3-keto-disaccharide hydrolase